MKINEMKKINKLPLLYVLFLSFSLNAQVTTKVNHDVLISNSTIVKLGHSDQVRNLTKKSRTPETKREQNRRFKKVPDNFKGRNGKSKSIYSALEHQGLDPVRQYQFNGMTSNSRLHKGACSKLVFGFSTLVFGL